MKKFGYGLLFCWLGINSLLAGVILIRLTIFHINAPGLRILLSDERIHQLDPQALSTVNALAVLANGMIVAVCGLSGVLLWKGKHKKQKWVFGIVSATLLYVQVLGFLSDALLNNRDLLANIVSSCVLIAGLFLIR